MRRRLPFACLASRLLLLTIVARADDVGEGLEAHIYDMRCFADINGQHLNVGGAPINFASSTWMWGGAAQLGMLYYFGPACFLDISYDFMATGSYTQNYTTPYSSTSGGYTEEGTIHVTALQRVTAQSFTITFNRLF